MLRLPLVLGQNESILSPFVAKNKPIQIKTTKTVINSE